MEVTCANCGYEAPQAEFEAKAQETEALRRKQAREEGKEVEAGWFHSVVCPECGHSGLLLG